MAKICSENKSMKRSRCIVDSDFAKKFESSCMHGWKRMALVLFFATNSLSDALEKRRMTRDI